MFNYSVTRKQDLHKNIEKKSLKESNLLMYFYLIIATQMIK